MSVPVNAPGAAARAIRDMALRAAEHQVRHQQYAEVINASPLNVQLASGLTLDDDDLVLGASVRSYDKGNGLARGDTLVVVQMDNDDWLAVDVVADAEITGVGGGPGTGDKNYVHTQGSPSATWTVVHGLAKYPSISVVDSGDSVVIPDVHYVDNNTATLTFGSATSGKAYVN